MKNVKMHVILKMLTLVIITNLNILSQIKVKNAFPELSFENPVDIQFSPDSTNRLFIIEQAGEIHVFSNDSSEAVSTEFLDIKNAVEFGGEKGLLGLAFHPDYSSNGYFYLNYTADNPLRTVISRFSRSAEDFNKADKSTEQILLEVEQPYSNHNGGQIAFGPDGYLYISLGDGGSGGDPGNRAQNLSSFLGKILRINVDSSDIERNYVIPGDNPFINDSTRLKEIYAYGLRNVWRFSFDSSGQLWAADVGQNAKEEVNIIENGGNYGWRIMEGTQCYNPANNCDQNGLILPVLEYNHTQSGGYSITGGYVYEGSNLPALSNSYIYADFITGNIWAYNQTNDKISFLLKYNEPISAFGIDENNELYFADYNNGSIYKFIDDNINSVEEVNEFGFRLSQNYPNPFNPTTIINYSIKRLPNLRESVFVELTIQNLLGETIKTLVSEKQGYGSYTISFDGNNLSAGIYFYTLQANNYLETKKMILLK